MPHLNYRYTVYTDKTSKSYEVSYDRMVTTPMSNGQTLFEFWRNPQQGEKPVDEAKGMHVFSLLLAGSHTMVSQPREVW